MMLENQRFLLEQVQVSMCCMGLDLSCFHFKSLQYQGWSQIPFALSLPLASGFLLLSALVLKRAGTTLSCKVRRGLLNLTTLPELIGSIVSFSLASESLPLSTVCPQGTYQPPALTNGLTNH